MAGADALSARVEAAIRESRAAGIVAGSVTVRAVRIIFRSLSGQASFIGRRLTQRPATRRFDATVEVMTRSALYRAVSALLSAFGPDSWADSALGRAIGRCWGPLALASKVRLLGWFVGVASVSRAALSPSTLLDSRVALVSWLALLALGASLFVFSPIVAAAWASRKQMAGTEVAD